LVEVVIGGVTGEEEGFMVEKGNLVVVVVVVVVAVGVGIGGGGEEE